MELTPATAKRCKIDLIQPDLVDTKDGLNWLALSMVSFNIRPRLDVKRKGSSIMKCSEKRLKSHSLVLINQGNVSKPAEGL